MFVRLRPRGLEGQQHCADHWLEATMDDLHLRELLGDSFLQAVSMQNARMPEHSSGERQSERTGFQFDATRGGNSVVTEYSRVLFDQVSGCRVSGFSGIEQQGGQRAYISLMNALSCREQVQDIFDAAAAEEIKYSFSQGGGWIYTQL